jgi:polyhydroxyalkanoate synthesis regulator phasin
MEVKAPQMSNASTTSKFIDPLAVDQEPTDEQLAAVMDDVARVAREKRVVADERFREQMAEDLRAAEVRMTYLRKQLSASRR